MTETEAYTMALLLKAHLEEKKAVDTVLIDLRGRATFTDVFVVATGTSTTHVTTLTEEADRFFHQHAVRVLNVAGLPEATWTLVDAGDIVVHLFQQEARTFYDLEKLWISKAPPAPPQQPTQTAEPEQPEKPEKADKIKKEKKGEKPEKVKKAEKSDKKEEKVKKEKKPEKTPKAGKAEKAEKPVKPVETPKP